MKRDRLIKLVLLLLLLVGFSCSAWGKTVTLSWDASPSSIAGYKIYYDVNSSTSQLEGSGAQQGDSPIDAGNQLSYEITGLPDAADHYFAVTAYDDAGNESAYSNLVHSAPVSSVNVAPVLAAIGNKSTAEGTTLSFTLSASDADEGDTLTYTVSGLPTGAGFNGSSGVFTWTPTFTQQGRYNVTFTVSDGVAGDSETVAINVVDVNRAPVVGQIGAVTVSEGGVRSIQVVATDPDNDNLTYSFSPALPGASIDSSSGLFRWQPTYDQDGVYNTVFAVSDGAATTTQNVTITVLNVNRAPVLKAVGPQSLAEGVDFNLVIEATDADKDSLIYTMSGRPPMAVFTPSTRSFSWTPGSDDAGTYEVTFTVSDGSLSDSQTVTLTVADSNEAPVLAAIGSQSVSEGQLLEFVISATDSNNDNLTYSATSLPSGAEFNSQERRFRWTPDYTQAGSFNVVFGVTDNVFSDSETVAITVINSNRPPQISGTPLTSAMATVAYSFTPVVVDPDGDPLTFTIENKPGWADFNSSNGRLSGTPDATQVGTFSNIRIHVKDLNVSAALTPFAITVAAYASVDSDGDGVPDHLDAFPNDPDEWLDTDGDGIGNNADDDDDNDGVADIYDGAPLDPTSAGWVITAVNGTGGYITPAGETAVLYGGSQRYELSAMAGYYINDVRIDGVSVGLVDHYIFDNVDDHHNVEAVFAPIPQGLSYDPLSSGLVGIERLDGGDDRTNLVDGKPKSNISYRFEIVLRDSVVATQRRVFLVLNEYKYPMVLSGGTLNYGGNYAFETRLGPAASHQYYFEAEDLSGQRLWRYPHSGSLNGPVVELLNGKNLVGLAADINAHGLSATEAFNRNAYRWQINTGSAEAFETVNTGAPVVSGEGYVLNQMTRGTLPDQRMYGQVDAAVYSMSVQGGWNLISNPYGGNIALADIKVRRGNEPEVTWGEAVADKLVVDVIYSYLGDDWGKSNEFSSAVGENPAVLVPWTGYWVYINPSAETITLLFPKPLQ